MKKMTTLFEKDLTDLSKVIDGEINIKNMWVFDKGVKATRKFDGTACAIINGKLFKRYDARINIETKEYKKPLPTGAIPCQEADVITGHHPHWVECNLNNNEDKWHFIGYNNLPYRQDGTYELCGVKIQKNPEHLTDHELIKHGSIEYPTEEVLINPRKFMKDKDIEGIVFHHPDGRMCKIRKKDFGDKRRNK